MSEEIIMSQPSSADKPPKKILTRAKKRLIFYTLMMVYPIVQMAIFYFYLNFSSILMAFQDFSIDYGGGGYIIKYTFDNFSKAWAEFTSSGWMIKNSLRMFLISLVVSMNLAIIFSFYVYKKCPGAEFFRVILFLPHVISGVVFVMLFKYMANGVYLDIVERLTGSRPLRGLLADPKTSLGVVIFYGVWHSFGSNVLMYCGTMSSIDESLVESAQLDGANVIHEFIYITFPFIYRTYITFLVVSISGILTNQMNLYTFFGTEAGYDATIGYTMYINTLRSDVIAPNAKYLSYPVLSAYGLILTLIVSPTTMFIKKGLEKIGPSAS